MNKKIGLFLTLFVVLSISVFAQGQKNDMMRNQADIDHQIEGGEMEDLTTDEIDGLLLMREEEKLAHDVYTTLYDKWSMQIFTNIARSEQTHTNAVKELLDAYSIDDPVSTDEVGVFNNEELAQLYDTLVEQGSQSLLDAFIVGAIIEDLDIKDLNELLESTTNTDIILVYENLRKGSRNHMRSFIKQIESQDGEYTAQYISTEELEEIIGGSQESGPILTDDSDIDLPALRNRMGRQNNKDTGKQQLGKMSEFGNKFKGQNGAKLGANGVINNLKNMNEYTDSPLGKKVSEFAKNYQNSYNKALGYEKEIESRNGFSRFLFGGNKKLAQNLNEEVKQNKEQVQSLLSDLETADEEETTLIREQIKELQTESNRMEGIANQEAKKKGLFRWW